MKTSLRVINILAVMVGLPVAGLFGQPVIHYLENSPVSASGDAAADSFESGGQFSFEELSREFGSESSAPAGTATTSTTSATSGEAAGTQQQVGVEVSGGTFEVQGQETDIYTVKIPYSRRLNERATLELAVPLSFSNYKDAIGPKDAKAYGAGINAGYAWQAFLKKDNVPYRWKLTPSAGLYYRDSNDMNAGAWVFSTGFSSSFAWQFSPGWVVNVGNSISFAWHNGIKDYADPIRDDQQTLKNGIQLYRMMDRWTVYGYVTHTQSLNDMIVDSYRTYGVAAGYKLTKTRTLKASIYCEEGNGQYRATHGTLGTNWQF
jgi:hypothetical protein